MLTQSVCTLVVNTSGFIVLAWLLESTAFGLFAMTQTIASLAGLAQQVGVRTIVINRFQCFAIWANPAFWLTAALGATAMVLMLIAAPIGQAIYDTPELLGMVSIMALSIPLRALTIVPEASLAARMRFRLLALIQMGHATGLITLQVTCALLGFEAYSFVIPHPIIIGILLVIMLGFARPPLRLNPQLRRWRYLVGDAVRLFFSNFSNWIVSQFGYVALGLFQSAAAVGLFFFGLRLSMRTIALLISALRNVLLPALRKIHDNPQRQAHAFLRLARMLALIGTPGCALQAALAQPGFQLLLPQDKYEAIAVVQVLSVGAAFQLLSQPALQLLRAQGRFTALLVQSIVFSTLFLITITTAAIIGAQTHVAVAVLLFYLIAGPAQMYLAVIHGNCGWRDVASVFARPVTFAAIAFGAPWLAGQTLNQSMAADIVRVIGIPVIGCSLYLVLVMRFAPDEFNDLRERLMNTIARKRNKTDEQQQHEALPMSQ